jgi:hypothetical protein
LGDCVAGIVARQPRDDLLGRAAQIELDRAARDVVEDHYRRLFATCQHLSDRQRHFGQRA